MKLQAFDLIAPFYDLFLAVFRREIPQKILSRLKRGDRETVLDLGGGTGYNGARLTNAWRRVVVLDVSLQMLRHAKKYGALDLVLGDARSLPFKSKSFDLVVAVDSLHHVKDYPGVLKEVQRTGRDKVLVAEFFGRTLAGKMLTGLERLFLPVLYKRPEEFRREASNQGIPGDYEYISGFEYFFVGSVKKGNQVPDSKSDGLSLCR